MTAITITEPDECPVCHDRTFAPGQPCSEQCASKLADANPVTWKDAFEEQLYRLLEQEFMRDGQCGLCGNSGIVDTIGIARTATGKPNGVRAHCICPNGRRAKDLGIPIPAQGRFA